MARTVIDGMNVIGSRADGWWRAQPIQLPADDAAPQQLLARPNHHRAILGADVDDVHRDAKATGQPAPPTPPVPPPSPTVKDGL